MTQVVKLSRIRPRSQILVRPVRTLQWRPSSSLNHFIAREPLPDPAAQASAPSNPRKRLAVKDNIATRDFPTTCASGVLAGYASPFEATIVSQLRDRGYRVVGKTNMDEFGMGSHSVHSAHGAVRNARSRGAMDDEVLSAGGSSGGSAVAVACGDADLALGTDTGGSIRLPAAYNDVVGFKPSYGMISRFGVVPYANSLDTVGFLARDVKTIWELFSPAGSAAPPLDSIHDPSDPTSLPEATRREIQKEQTVPTPAFRSLTIGVPIEYNIEELDPKVRADWASALAWFQAAGAAVVPVSLPLTKQALSAYYVIAPAEASSNLAKYDGVRYGARGTESDAADHVLYAKTRGDGFGDEVKRRILLGSYSLSSEAIDNYFIQAQKVRRLVQRDFDRVFKVANPLGDGEQFDLTDLPEDTMLADKRGPPQVDFLLCPTAPTLPPRIKDVKNQTPVESYMNDVLTVPASLAGLPAISIPSVRMPRVGETERGLHMAGLQLIGQYWDDVRLLQVALAVEAEFKRMA